MTRTDKARRGRRMKDLMMFCWGIECGVEREVVFLSA